MSEPDSAHSLGPSDPTLAQIINERANTFRRIIKIAFSAVLDIVCLEGNQAAGRWISTNEDSTDIKAFPNEGLSQQYRRRF